VPTIILRSLLGRVAAAVVGLIGLYPVAVIWLADGYGHGLQALSAAFAVTVAAWLLWWRPLMRLDQESIRVRNAFRSHRVAWDAVTGVQSRWGLVLVLAGTDAGAGPGNPGPAASSLRITALLIFAFSVLIPGACLRSGKARAVAIRTGAESSRLRTRRGRAVGGTTSV